MVSGYHYHGQWWFSDFFSCVCDLQLKRGIAKIHIGKRTKVNGLPYWKKNFHWNINLAILLIAKLLNLNSDFHKPCNDSIIWTIVIFYNLLMRTKEIFFQILSCWMVCPLTCGIFSSLSALWTSLGKCSARALNLLFG